MPSNHVIALNSAFRNDTLVSNLSSPSVGPCANVDHLQSELRPFLQSSRPRFLMLVTTKQTRSQSAVPDGILQHLKDAPTALHDHLHRNHVPTSDRGTEGYDMEIVGDSEEDEILLSPRKKQRTKEARMSTKRPSSPLVDPMDSPHSGGGQVRKRRRRNSNSSEQLDNSVPTSSALPIHPTPEESRTATTSGLFSVDSALSMTPKPFDLAVWPDMSPLTPLLETPFPNRIDPGDSDVKLACFDVSTPTATFDDFLTVNRPQAKRNLPWKRTLPLIQCPLKLAPRRHCLPPSPHPLLPAKAGFLSRLCHSCQTRSKRYPSKPPHLPMF